MSSFNHDSFLSTLSTFSGNVGAITAPADVFPDKFFYDYDPNKEEKLRIQKKGFMCNYKSIFAKVLMICVLALLFNIGNLFL